MEVANHTLAEATTTAPFIDYAVCVDDSNRPAKHVGDWPTEGTVYAVRATDGLAEGSTLIHVLGFTGVAPYFNAFAPHRFEIIARLWLN